MAETSSAVNNKCQWCGQVHFTEGKCPTVKAYEYNPDGTLKRVEFFAPNDYAPIIQPAPMMPVTIGDVVVGAHG